MTTPELLAAILAELQAMRKYNIQARTDLDTVLTELIALRRDLTAKPEPRVFVPEDVRRALGADRVECYPSADPRYWKLCVYYGPIRAGGPPTDSMSYSALSSEGFTTEEAITVIEKQRPTVPA